MNKFNRLPHNEFCSIHNILDGTLQYKPIFKISSHGEEPITRSVGKRTVRKYACTSHKNAKDFLLMRKVAMSTLEKQSYAKYYLIDENKKTIHFEKHAY